MPNALGEVTIHAYIKPENGASVRAFERVGFTLSGESGKFGPSGQASLGHDTPYLLYVNSQ